MAGMHIDGRATAADWTRQVGLLAAALFQILANAAPRVFDFGVDVAIRSARLDTPIIPAGWAFAIWGLIFLWGVAYAVYGLTPGAVASAVMRRSAGPAALAFVANGVWGLYAPLFDIDPVSFAIIAAGLAAAMAALFGAASGPLTRLETALVKAPLAILAGWLTAATFVGASSVWRQVGGEAAPAMLAGLLAATVLVGAVTARYAGGWLYAAAIIWALAGIVAKNLGQAPEYAALAAGGAAIMAIAAASFRARV